MTRRESPIDSLTDEEKQKLAELRETVNSWELDEEQKEFCTDLTLYRYLFGLSWDMEAVNKQLKDTLDWRKEYRPQDIRLEELEPVARSGWLFTADLVDKDSRPILYMLVQNDSSAADENLDIKFRHIAYTLETMFQKMKEPGMENVYQVTWIVDFKNVSLSVDLVKKLKSAMGNVGYYYPENLCKIYVNNVGWVVNLMFAFARTFMTKRMLDKYVVVHYKETLLEAVEADQLLEILGGESTFVFDFDEEVKKDKERAAKRVKQ